MPVAPDETDTPLCIDANTMLAFTGALCLVPQRKGMNWIDAAVPGSRYFRNSPPVALLTAATIFALRASIS
jgi:hypothetical protein